MSTPKLIPLKGGRVYRLDRPRRRVNLLRSVRRAWNGYSARNGR
jgi:hypothetical protein